MNVKFKSKNEKKQTGSSRYDMFKLSAEREGS
jgi:hypothetical protein